jgi:hypothetical protein
VSSTFEFDVSVMQPIDCIPTANMTTMNNWVIRMQLLGGVPDTSAGACCIVSESRSGYCGRCSSHHELTVVA